MSALGVTRRCGAAYGETKAMAEERVRRAPIPSAIIAPSILYGPGSEIVAMLGLLARLPLVPIPTLTAAFRPIHVRDAARIAVDVAVGSGEADYIPLGGPERLTAGEVAATFLRARGTPMWSIPASLSRLLVGLVSRVKLPGAPADLAPMLAIDNAGSAPPEADRLTRYSHWVSQTDYRVVPPGD
ncbi:MAG: SDR family oxidoreductase [Alkalispirochaeta sp.]